MAVTGFSAILNATADDSPQAVDVWWESTWHRGLLLGCRIQEDGSALAKISRDSVVGRAVIWAPFDRLRLATHRPAPEAGQQTAEAHPSGSTVPGCAQGSGLGGRHRLRQAAGEPTSTVSGAADDPATVRLPLTRVAVPASGDPVSSVDRAERKRSSGSTRPPTIRTGSDRLPG
ncbi:MAG: hypothetical protein JWO67_6157 [Streptosporangiaceae bacterium]|nr:hypothetical protein [Streptosporangiaceae bacterium]